VLTTVARIVGPHDGKAGFLGSIGVRFMIDGGDADGRFSVVEHPMSPRALAAPLHRHTREDEYSYVLEGRMARFWVTTCCSEALATSSSSPGTNGIPSGMPAINPLGSWRSSLQPASNGSSPNSSILAAWFGQSRSA
jgi:hypothetical protein